jgi:hypothetical protein
MSREVGPLYQCVDTVNNITNISNYEQINNFSVDIYDLLKNQEMLIAQKNTDMQFKEKTAEKGGYKKSKKIKKNQKKTSRRNYNKKTHKNKNKKQKSSKKY